MKQKLKKPEPGSEEHGNDVLRGIERWMPAAGFRIPKAFKYKSASGIWYRSKLEESLMLQRAGDPEWEKTAPEAQPGAPAPQGEAEPAPEAQSEA